MAGQVALLGSDSKVTLKAIQISRDLATASRWSQASASDRGIHSRPEPLQAGDPVEPAGTGALVRRWRVLRWQRVAHSDQSGRPERRPIGSDTDANSPRGKTSSRTAAGRHAQLP